MYAHIRRGKFCSRQFTLKISPAEIMQTDGKENQKALKNSRNYIYQFYYK